MHPRPGRVIGAYARGAFNGNLLELLEPGFADLFRPGIIDNTRFPAHWLNLFGSPTGPEAREAELRALWEAVLAPGRDAKKAHALGEGLECA
jgi:hypothetical protein